METHAKNWLVAVGIALSVGLLLHLLVLRGLRDDVGDLNVVMEKKKKVVAQYYPFIGILLDEYRTFLETQSHTQDGDLIKYQVALVPPRDPQQLFDLKEGEGQLGPQFDEMLLRIQGPILPPLIGQHNRAGAYLRFDEVLAPSSVLGFKVGVEREDEEVRHLVIHLETLYRIALKLIDIQKEGGKVYRVKKMSYSYPPLPVGPSPSVTFLRAYTVSVEADMDIVALTRLLYTLSDGVGDKKDLYPVKSVRAVPVPGEEGTLQVNLEVRRFVFLSAEEERQSRRMEARKIYKEPPGI